MTNFLSLKIGMHIWYMFTSTRKTVNSYLTLSRYKVPYIFMSYNLFSWDLI